MLGIRGAKLKFEFHVIDKAPRPVKCGWFEGAKDRLKGLWCGGEKRKDSAVDMKSDVWGFELMDDLVRSHAVVPAGRSWAGIVSVSETENREHSQRNTTSVLLEKSSDGASARIVTRSFAV